jgi:sialate O-acetylesterase
VPIGIIQSAFGGSNIHPWIPAEELRSTPILKRYYDEWEKANKTYEEAFKSDKNATHPFDGILEYNRLKPVTLYNAMVAPVVPYALAGILWYQGESDIGQGMMYADKMKALIAGWRRVFNQPGLPFYYVELPPWNYGNEKMLPAMWEAQESCLSIPNTGMAVAVDVGDAKDIHPTRKKEVGERLALMALANIYGKTEIESSGPVFKDMKIDKDKAVVSFDHANKGLMTKDGKPLEWFTIAGADGVFVAADAKIAGNTVVVSSGKVKEPVAVRYAWSGMATNPDPNLYNKEGLPARPFRTDK